MNLKISATLGPFNLIGPNQFWLLPSQSLSVYPFSMQNQWVWLSCLSIIVGLRNMFKYQLRIIGQKAQQDTPLENTDKLKG